MNLYIISSDTTNRKDADTESFISGAKFFQKNMPKSAHEFAASKHAIEKALSTKAPANNLGLLPLYLLPLIQVLNSKNATILRPHGPGIYYQIPLEVDNNSEEKDVPQGSLYNVSWNELSILWKTLNELSEKKWIRQSKTICGASSLFTKP